MSASELAERAGLERSYVSKIERGERSNLGLATLDRLARALDYSLVELVEDLGYGTDVSPEDEEAWRRDLIRMLEALPAEVREMQLEQLRALVESYERRRRRREAGERRRGQGEPGARSE